MAESVWYGQKAAASTFVKQQLADGQEKPIEVLVAGLKATGVTRKNAQKAIYAEIAAGTAVMTGSWVDGTIKKGGA